MSRAVLLSSSLRTTPPEVTLARAKKRALPLGITRVTDITRLDRLAIPVYASIRPGAAPGSLCVNAGKGLHPIEAEVGAYMEAIEYALAEPGASTAVTRVRATARDVLDGRQRPEAILDLCPKLGAEIDLDAPMECVVAESIMSKERVLVPAELVFLPFRPHAGYRGRFGTSSNGLASGNTLREATVHALSELIERDVRSFDAFADASAPVNLDSVPEPAAGVVESVRAAGLELYVRTTRNAFGLPYFTAVIHDPDAWSPCLLNGGYGCHPHRSVAFVRAVAEAAQSRLSFIHGGRDDLVEHHARFEGWGASRKRAHVKRVVEHASKGKRAPWDTVDDCSDLAKTVPGCEELLLGRLAGLGFHQSCRVALSLPEDDLQVVRVLVPGLELFNETVYRVGPRLRQHALAS
jgi:ribosomal protein S12 methylthiotransferase accessory factor